LATLTCPPGRTEIIYWDGSLSGFGLRCRADGSRRWVVQYRAKVGGQRRSALGDPALVTLTKARKAASALLAEAKVGNDPAGERERLRQCETVKQLIDAYLAAQKTHLRPRSYAEVARHLSVAAKPLHGKHADAVTAREVVLLLDAVKNERGPYSANRLRAALSALFAWAMKQQRMAANPVAATNRVTEERSRDRVLGLDELATIWAATSGGGDHERIVRLLLLTGARREEVGAMAWSELTVNDDGTASWALPSSRTKNGKPLDMVLPPLAVQQLPERREGRAYVFGTGKGGYSGWSVAKKAIDTRIGRMGHPLDEWRLHDLRRSFVTHLNESGIEPHVIEALVNHISGTAKAGVADVYNRAAYAVPKKNALALWALTIEKIVEEPVFNKAMHDEFAVASAIKTAHEASAPNSTAAKKAYARIEAAKIVRNSIQAENKTGRNVPLVLVSPIEDGEISSDWQRVMVSIEEQEQSSRVKGGLRNPRSQISTAETLLNNGIGPQENMSRKAKQVLEKAIGKGDHQEAARKRLSKLNGHIATKI